MRQLSAEEQQLANRAEEIRKVMATHGRWHIRRRKSDSNRFWKLIYKNLELAMAQPHPFHKSQPLMAIEVAINSGRYTLKTHMSTHTAFKQFQGKSLDIENTIAEINAALAHYKLSFVETEESAKRHITRNLSIHRTYTMKFIEDV